MRKLATCLFVTTLSLLVGAAPARAEGYEGQLPARFVRVATLADLTTEGYYAIGAVAKSGNAYLLSQEIRPGSDAKLVGAGVADGLRSEVNVADGNTVWRLAATPTGGQNTYLLTSADGSLTVSAPMAKSKTTLTVSTTERTAWIIGQNADGTFTLRNASDTARALGLFEQNAPDAFFGNYTSYGSDSRALYIYRLPTRLSELTGQATTPPDGTRCALATDSCLATTQMTALSKTGYELNDGSLAEGDDMAVFTATVSDAGTFSLRTDAGYLGYDLSTGDEAAAWRVVNGHISTVEAAPRYLAYSASTGRFGVWDDEEALRQGVTSVTLPAVAAPPTANTGSDGALNLTGGWSAQRLATIDLSASTALYLDSISLPVAAEAFQDDGENNTIIYINAADTAVAPQSWRLVVFGGQSSAQLLRAAVLTDRRPLYIGRSFTAQAGQLTYKRQCAADGNWETLCLPFAAELPEGFHVETLTTANQGELTFDDATAIEAQQPVIFRQNGTGNAEMVLTNSKTAQLSQEDSPAAAQVLIGNYRMLTLTAQDADIYLLSGDGDYFVRALPGSALDPFRCYLRLDAQSDSIRVKHGLTGIQSAHAEKQSAPSYDLAGRKLHGEPSRGIYITQGKKHIKL